MKSLALSVEIVTEFGAISVRIKMKPFYLCQNQKLNFDQWQWKMIRDFSSTLKGHGYIITGFFFVCVIGF